ncbi:MAG: hypothetical protein KDD60_04045, partial [Bdellovibrionales bacterium]|nr:hypothetical protein [Bdellovibrionales bacterium]
MSSRVLILFIFLFLVHSACAETIGTTRIHVTTPNGADATNLLVELYPYGESERVFSGVTNSLGKVEQANLPEGLYVLYL